MAEKTDGPIDKPCPVCGALTQDYCELARCEWNPTDIDAATGCADDNSELGKMIGSLFSA